MGMDMLYGHVFASGQEGNLVALEGRHGYPVQNKRRSFSVCSSPSAKKNGIQIIKL